MIAWTSSITKFVRLFLKELRPFNYLRKWFQKSYGPLLFVTRNLFKCLTIAFFSNWSFWRVVHRLAELLLRNIYTQKKSNKFII